MELRWLTGLFTQICHRGCHVSVESGRGNAIVASRVSDTDTDHVRNIVVNSEQNLLIRVLQTRQQFTNIWMRFEQQIPF
jgi:hypothetical protein